MPAKNFVESDESLVPINIAELPQEMNFSTKTKIGDKLAKESKYLSDGGIDHCYTVDGEVKLEDPVNGR
ncbi:MAG: aldose 1-epimerase [Francisella sp.]